MVQIIKLIHDCILLYYKKYPLSKPIKIQMKAHQDLNMKISEIHLLIFNCIEVLIRVGMSESLGGIVCILWYISLST